MTRIVIGIVTGLAAVIIVYFAFLEHEFVKAGRANMAVGAGVLLYVATRPTFLIAAAVSFALILYIIRR